MEKKKYMCAKCGEVEVSFEGAYCDRYRSAINSVEETGDWAEDMRRRRDAINSMFR